MSSSTEYSHRTKIQVVLDFIRGNLEHPLDPGELAVMSGFSLWHFYRVFREVTGKSLREFIRDERLKKAASRLRTGEEPVVQIALDSGYETHSGFTRAFRAHFSEPPMRYRESAKTSNPRASVATGIRKDTNLHRHQASDSMMRLRHPSITPRYPQQILGSARYSMLPRTKFSLS